MGSNRWFTQARSNHLVRGRALRIETLEDRRLLAITVDTLEDVTANDGFTSLREAITTANSTAEDTINFSSLFDAAQTIELLSVNGELRITESLIITGPGQELLTIDAKQNSRVVNFSSTSGNLTISGLTITGGRQTYGRGGGIRFNSDGLLTLTDSAVQFNRTTSYNGFGGGIFAASGDVLITNSTVSGNTSSTEGGGIYTDSGNLTLASSTVSDNSSDTRGGGIFVNTGTISVVNSTISGNDADGSDSFGGGVFSRSVNVSLSSSTVTDNGASTAGGGVFIYNAALNPLLNIENSIIAENTANIRQDLSPDTDGTLTINYSLIGIADGLTITGNVGNLTGTTAEPLDPLLRPLASNGGPTQTRALSQGSPATDAGADLGLEFDQRGINYVRKLGDRVDIGAFELQPEPLPTADFDQDGDIDGGDFLSWQRNFGTRSGARLADGDADRDRDVDNFDLANWEQAYSLNSIPTFTFTASFFAANDGTDNNDVDLGYLNDDEYLDAFVTGRFFSSQGPANRVYFGNEDGTFTNNEQPFGLGTNFSALGDIDNDGDIDAVTADISGVVNIWKNDGNGFFTNAGFLTVSNPIDVALAHLNGDDRLDLFVAQDASNGLPNLVFLNDISLGFVDSGQQLGNGPSKGIELADLNGDSFLDAFVANSAQDSSNTVWFNDGNGIFTDSGQRLGDGDSRHVALGDLDGDGDIDAFEANVGVNRIWLNDGQGLFTVTEQLLGTSITSHVVLGDLDLDGDLDAFTANFSDVEPDRVWLNNGSAEFSLFALEFPNDTSSHAALGDLDLDGDLDIVIAGWSTNNPNAIWLNNVASTPAASLRAAISSEPSYLSPIGIEDERVSNLTLNALGTFNVQAADLDGDPDGYVANWFDQPDRIWINNGVGLFQASQSLGGETSSHVALGDIDNDGDIDAVVAAFSTSQINQIWLNETADEPDSLADALIDGDLDTAAVDSALADDEP